MRLLIIISVSSRPGMSLVRDWQVAVADMSRFVFFETQISNIVDIGENWVHFHHIMVEQSTSLMFSVVGTPLIPCFIASLIDLADVYIAQAYLPLVRYILVVFSACSNQHFKHYIHHILPDMVSTHLNSVCLVQAGKSTAYLGLEFGVALSVPTSSLH